MKKVDFLFFDAGGGHRAAATALKMVIEQERRPWQARLVHLRDVLDSIDVFRKVTRIDLQEIYNLMLRKGWTLGSPQGLRFMQAVIRLYRGPAVRLIRDFWKKDPPDLAVSVVPNFNRALFEGFSQAAPGRPYVTILTDLADYPPRFWMERQPQYFICGTPKAAQQARDLGHPANRIFCTSGMILHPRFYEKAEINRAEERTKLGLDPEKPTGLVLFGGYGSDEMRGILQRIDSSGLDVQLILICGKNEKLRRDLAGRTTRLVKVVEGFTSNIPYYMRLSDFFVGKPGPGSVSEAIQMGLPVITVRNIWTLPQERYNAEWLVENDLGVALRGYDEVVGAVRQLLTGGRLAQLRANAEAHRNNAIFEIPPILDTILASSR